MVNPAALTGARFRSKIVGMALPEGVVIVDVPVAGDGGGGDPMVCADCEKPLKGRPYVVIDGAILCMDCVEETDVDDDDDLDDDDDEDGDEFDDDDEDGDDEDGDDDDED
jgi:hypothetical protein